MVIVEIKHPHPSRVVSPLCSKLFILSPLNPTIARSSRSNNWRTQRECKPYERVFACTKKKLIVDHQDPIISRITVAPRGKEQHRETRGKGVIRLGMVRQEVPSPYFACTISRQRGENACKMRRAISCPVIRLDSRLSGRKGLFVRWLSVTLSASKVDCLYL